MSRAVELAGQCVSEDGRTSPKVAAVAVRDGHVIGQAYRGELKPGEHAEYTLLERKLKDVDLDGATLYTTLEPCTERNPPKRACVERIIDRGISKVYIGMLDPNDRIRGLGQLRLREAKIVTHFFYSRHMTALERLNRGFIRDQDRRGRLLRVRPAAALTPGAEGPNGHPLGYTKSGDLVEWLPSEEKSNEAWPMIVRRSDRSIMKAYDEFWDKVWWNRHQIWLERIQTGEEVLTPERKKILVQAKKAARRIERKYGKDKLGWDDFDWGLLSGRMSALAWVMGMEWDESLDT